MKIRPLHDRVIVKREEAETKTAGGIIIPDSAKEKPQEGEVVAVGNGIRREDGTVSPLDVKAGDKILFSKYAGTEIKIDGDELLGVASREASKTSIRRSEAMPSPPTGPSVILTRCISICARFIQSMT